MIIKKAILMFVITGIISTTSCNKKSNYDCDCSSTESFGGITTEIGIARYRFINVKEEDALEDCNDLNSTGSYSISGLARYQNTTCSLK
jgi:hypothetical protein